MIRLTATGELIFDDLNTAIEAQRMFRAEAAAATPATPAAPVNTVDASAMARELRGTGLSLRAVAAELAAHGVSRPDGSPLAAMQVSRLVPDDRPPVATVLELTAPATRDATRTKCPLVPADIFARLSDHALSNILRVHVSQIKKERARRRLPSPHRCVSGAATWGHILKVDPSGASAWLFLLQRLSMQPSRERFDILNDLVRQCPPSTKDACDLVASVKQWFHA